MAISTLASHWLWRPFRKAPPALLRERTELLFQAELPEEDRVELARFVRKRGFEPPGPKRGRPPYFGVLPGLWPLPLGVSLVALALGAEGIDDIMTWLRACRREHGYAWRVLVDFRHLAPVREHPKFVSFVAEEDERVESIESAIDAGEYPL